jgi:hypothetical protein
MFCGLSTGKSYSWIVWFDGSVSFSTSMSRLIRGCTAGRKRIPPSSATMFGMSGGRTESSRPPMCPLPSKRTIFRFGVACLSRQAL